jgi:hypothetical protein
MKQNDARPTNNNNNHSNQLNDDDKDDDSDERNSEDDDQDDWLWSEKETFGSSHSKDPNKTYDILKERYQSFVKKLPFCVPFDLGFMVYITFADADKFCWCPCQKNRFDNFRTMFQIDSGLSWTCPNTQKFTPLGLYQHLETKVNDSSDLELQILHRLAKRYIDIKYDQYNHDEKTDTWYKHKALYKLNTTEYRAAEACEFASIDANVKDFIRKLTIEKEQRVQRDKDIAELHKVSQKWFVACVNHFSVRCLSCDWTRG